MRSGTCLNASGLFFASNSHMEMGETIVKSIKKRTFLDCTILGVLLTALQEKYTYIYIYNVSEKSTPKGTA